MKNRERGLQECGIYPAEQSNRTFVLAFASKSLEQAKILPQECAAPAPECAYAMKGSTARPVPRLLGRMKGSRSYQARCFRLNLRAGQLPAFLTPIVDRN